MAVKEAVSLSEEEKRFVLSRRVARLATAGAEGRPHVVPLCYAFSGTHFYFVVDEKPKRKTGRPLKRLQNLLANPRVALVIDDYSDDWSKLAFVLIQGEAALVSAKREYEAALSLLRERYPQYREMRLSQEKNPAVRITPTKVHAWGALSKAAAADL
jgi:PPOX class probable F420-dependent enzyme